MICPNTNYDCDNPGCRHGGCQGRRPTPPLLRGLLETVPTPGQTAGGPILGAGDPATRRDLTPTLLPRDG